MQHNTGNLWARRMDQGRGRNGSLPVYVVVNQLGFLMFLHLQYLFDCRQSALRNTYHPYMKAEQHLPSRHSGLFAGPDVLYVHLSHCTALY
jgi:hypothetical protein